MKKIIILITTIFLISLIACYFIIANSITAQTVTITQDNEVLYVLDLNEDTTLDVAYEDRINTIEIKEGRVRVIHADCPDQTCMEMGYLKDLPIICLPNHLSIQFTNDSNEIDTNTK